MELEFDYRIQLATVPISTCTNECAQLTRLWFIKAKKNNDQPNPKVNVEFDQVKLKQYILNLSS